MRDMIRFKNKIKSFYFFFNFFLLLIIVFLYIKYMTCQDTWQKIVMWTRDWVLS